MHRPEIEMLPVGALKPNGKNARRHPQQQIDRLAEGIRRFGFLVPILIAEDGTILAGHARIMAACALGLERVPVIRVSHLSAAERRAFTIAGNRLCELASWDHAVLKNELVELTELDLDLTLTGFDKIDFEVVSEEPRPREHAPPSARSPGVGAKTRRATVARVGDVWCLGAHSLTCGGSDAAAAYRGRLAPSWTGKGRGDEFDLRAADEAVRKWQARTGLPALLDASGQTFDEVAAARLQAEAPGEANTTAGAARAPATH